MAVRSVIGRTIFKSYPVSSTSYVYTENASTGAEDGWISCKGEDHKFAQIYLGTLNATSVTYRIEGRFSDSSGVSRAASLHTESLTAPMSGTIDKIVSISEYVAELRIGVKMSKVATPNNFHARFGFAEST